MTFNKTTLFNGVTLLTYTMPYAKSVSINVVVKVGSRYESKQEIGISHFLEHMAFKGTCNRSSEAIAKEFDMIGGNFNAYTGREQTVYFSKVLPENTYTALEILADIMQNSLFNKEDVDKEYEVILEEIAAVQDDPDDLAFEKLYELAFKDQNLGRSILGTKENISKIDSDGLKQYLSKHYSSENIFISIGGNIDHSSLEKMVSKLFCNFIRGESQTFSEAKYVGGMSVVHKDLEQSVVVIGFPSIAYTNLTEYYKVQLLSIILGGGLSSRLFQQIRENLGLAYSVGAFNNSYQDTGIFSIYGATSNDKVRDLSDGFATEILKVIEDISAEELTRAKAQVKSAIFMAEEKSSYKSEEIGKNFAIFKKYFKVEDTIDQIMNIETQEITDIAGKIFAATPTISIVGGENVSGTVNYEEICKKLG